MQQYNIQVLTPAYNDIDQIADFYLSRVGPKSAEKITNALLKRIAELAQHPFIGAEHQDAFLQQRGYRKLICNDYICVYRIVETTVIIYRVVHGATDYPKLFM